MKSNDKTSAEHEVNLNSLVVPCGRCEGRKEEPDGSPCGRCGGNGRERTPEESARAFEKISKLEKASMDAFKEGLQNIR